MEGCSSLRWVRTGVYMKLRIRLCNHSDLRRTTPINKGNTTGDLIRCVRLETTRDTGNTLTPVGSRVEDFGRGRTRRNMRSSSSTLRSLMSGHSDLTMMTRLRLRAKSIHVNAYRPSCTTQTGSFFSTQPQSLRASNGNLGNQDVEA